jgi:midasin (ATPase involved in ribosome maturation)
MDTAKLDFLDHIVDRHNLILYRDRSPAFIRAITVLFPDFDPWNSDPVLEAFERQIVHTLFVSGHFRRSKIRQKEVSFSAFSLPKILPRQFRHDTQAFKTLLLEYFISQYTTCPVEFTAKALVVLQTIFEALQDGVVTPTTLGGGRKLRLESPNGVTREIFVIDWDAFDITHNADEDDDAEAFQLYDEEDADDSSDETDEATVLEMVAQDEQDMEDALDEEHKREKQFEQDRQDKEDALDEHELQEVEDDMSTDDE